MEKIKLTRPELKRQRDHLQMFERYLPTLRLKKQQLQAEILKVEAAVRAETVRRDGLLAAAAAWRRMLSEPTGVRPEELVRVRAQKTSVRNVAGIRLPLLESVEFETPVYSLLSVPPWVDKAALALRTIAESVERQKVLERQKQMLASELRKISQRVNLFEKVKIPQSRENIRVITIFLGDQQTAGIGSAKIAKTKQAETLEEAVAS